MGSQGMLAVLYRDQPAEEAAMPMKEMKVNIIGRSGMYRSCQRGVTRE